MKKKSRKNYSLYVFLSAIVIIFLVMGFVIWREYQATLSHSKEIIGSYSTQQADIIERFVDSQYESLRIVAEDFVFHVDVSDKDDIVSYLSRINEHTDFLRICYASSDGVSILDDGLIRNVANRDYFIQAMKGKDSLQRLESSTIPKTQLFILAVPIFKDGSVVGVIHGNYDVSILDELIKPSSIYSETYTMICSDTGDMVVAAENPDYTIVDENLFSSIKGSTMKSGETIESLKKKFLSGASGSFEYKLNSKTRYASYINLDSFSYANQKLVLVTIISRHFLDSEVSRVKNAYFVIAILILLVSYLVFLFYWKKEKKTQKELIDERNRLRVSEQQNRIANKLGGLNIGRYELETKTLYDDSGLVKPFGFGEVVSNVPEVFIDEGLVAPRSINDYRLFFSKLSVGEVEAKVIEIKVADGSFRWFRHDASIVEDASGQPYQAIIVFADVTEKMNMEAVYNNWQHEIENRDPSSYSFFRCNLTNGVSFDVAEGSLLDFEFLPESDTFNKRTRDLASRYVHLDDYDEYIHFLNAENLLASFHRGVRKSSFDFRFQKPIGVYRWIRATVEMYQYSDKEDVEILIFYEDIDEVKSKELETVSLLERDSLTGALNRNAFISHFDDLCSSEKDDKKHALLLIDLYNFKVVNELFGHDEGDKTLKNIVSKVQDCLGENDFIGRLGGDEFMVCLNGITSQSVIEKVILQIQAQIHKSFNQDVDICSNVGVAIYPIDGNDFESVYHKASLALSSAKKIGGEAFMVHKNSDDERPVEESSEAFVIKSKILIIDNQSDDIALLSGLFSNQYEVDGRDNLIEGLSYLRIHGLKTSAVILDYGIDGDKQAFFQTIQESKTLSRIPLICLCSEEERVKTIDYGASDYVTLPLDKRVIKSRVDNAIAKAQNHMLRAQISYLKDNDDYRSLFEEAGTVAIEYNRVIGSFSYDPNISKHILGNWDSRPLWQILLSDMVCETKQIQELQKAILSLTRFDSGKSVSMELVMRTPQKKSHWFSMKAVRCLDERNRVNKIIISFKDINDDVNTNKQLIFQAEHDSLTGLYNRATFIELVDQKLRSCAPDSYLLLCCDIDGFKQINERFGRSEGDKLLQYSAERFRVLAKIVNGLEGRLSNDVFSMLVPNIDGIMQRIESHITDFFDSYHLDIKITGRAGVYVISEPDIGAATMLDMAMMAVKSIKGQYGKKFAIFNQSMKAKIDKEKEIAFKMENALSQGEFDVYLQPQFNHATGQIVGTEALVRWIDPVDGIIPPLDFIPLFERNGFITRLDEYIWNLVARNLSEWIKAGHQAVPVSVNVSRADTLEPNFCEKLLAIVERHRIPVDLLHVEITESLFAEDTQRLVAVVEKLHSYGFLVEMDDFGSGYSSLNVLKDVPVDVIKLDMKFFSGVENLGRGGIIINAVLRMARWLGIPVIAEGVEQKSQADFLLGIGCFVIQGYLYSKPLPRREFEKKFIDNIAGVDNTKDLGESILDKKEFWNPDSNDSKLFNSFIGPAALVEINKDKYEFIRLNREFAKLVRVQEDSLSLKPDPLAVIDEDAHILKSAIEQCVVQGVSKRFIVRHAFSDGQIQNLSAKLIRIGQNKDRTIVMVLLDI